MNDPPRASKPNDDSPNDEVSQQAEPAPAGDDDWIDALVRRVRPEIETSRIDAIRKALFRSKS